jgi:hypothetical protein
MRLEPLADDEAREIIARTAPELEDDAREQIVSLAEGNALYAQQLATLAAESGKALEPGAMPATLEAVLAGRLGRLEAGERATLQRAAVVGREFSRGAVAALAPPDLAVDAHLLALARRGFVHPAGDSVPADDAYRFHHVLLRDAAYATLTKEQRAELHERVAEWLDRDGEGDDAIVGYHLEQAASYLIEVGRPSDEVAARAGERLGRAGIRAWSRNDGSAALNLLGRAVALMPPSGRRAELNYERAIVLHTRGSASPQGTAIEEGVLAEVVEEAVVFGERRIEVRARLELARLAQLNGRLSPGELISHAGDAIPVLEAEEDHRGLGRAWMAISDAHSFRCEMEAMGQAAARAYGHYRLADFTTQAPLRAQAEALFYGPAPVEHATQEAFRLLDQTIDRPGAASVTAVLGGLHALSGRFEEARRLAGQAQEVYVDLGSVRSLEIDVAPLLMEIERLAGNLDEAVSIGRRSIDRLLGFGANAHTATRAAQVADIEISRGNVAEASRLLTVAKRNAVKYDTLSQYLNRAIQARVEAHHGRRQAAERLARQAVRLATGTDSVSDRVRVLVALEEVLRLGGDHDGARQTAAEAEALLAAKGSSAGVARLREQLSDALPA